LGAQMLKFFLILIFTSFAIESADHSSKELRIALLHTPGVLESASDNFPYNKLLTYLSENYKPAFYTSYYPYERANYLLQTKQVDCLFPVVKGEKREELETLYSETINNISVLIFSLESEYKSFEEIKGKTVIYYRGFGFGHWNLKDKDQIVFVPIEDKKNATNLLKKGRATAYIDYYPDIKKTVSPEELSRLKYAKKHPLKNFEDSFECYNSEDNKKFIIWLNKMIRTMKSSGQLKYFLDDYYNF
jgi:ABC-type amino acid transport substrate-binding protein